MEGKESEIFSPRSLSLLSSVAFIFKHASTIKTPSFVTTNVLEDVLVQSLTTLSHGFATSRSETQQRDPRPDPYAKAGQRMTLAPHRSKMENATCGGRFKMMLPLQRVPNKRNPSHISQQEPVPLIAAICSAALPFAELSSVRFSFTAAWSRFCLKEDDDPCVCVYSRTSTQRALSVVMMGSPPQCWGWHWGLWSYFPLWGGGTGLGKVLYVWN